VGGTYTSREGARNGAEGGAEEHDGNSLSQRGGSWTKGERWCQGETRPRRRPITRHRACSARRCATAASRLGRDSTMHTSVGGVWSVEREAAWE